MNEGEGRRIKIVRLGGLPPAPPVRWLWKGFVPYGFLTLGEGEEGLGKGYLAAWLAVRCAQGKVDGVKRAVVWLTSEETSEKIQARLLVQGYDHTEDAPVIQLVVSDETLITLPKDRDWFFKLAEQLGMPIGLVVVDVLRDHSDMTGAPEVRVKSNNDESWIRPAARAWERLAETLGCAVFGLHHRNKSSEGTARTKSTGSGAWRQVSRHVVVLAKVVGQTALAVDKTNVARENKEPIGFSLELVKLGVDEDGEEVTEAIFRPGSRTGHVDINDWERETAKAADLDPTEFVQVWLEDALQDGKLRHGDFFDKGFVVRGTGIKPDVVDKVFRELRLKGFMDNKARSGWFIPRPKPTLTVVLP